MALGLMTTIAACGGGGEKADNPNTADEQGQEVATDGEATEGEMP